MFVAMVTIPGRPASAIIWASLACCLAFNTLCFILACFNAAEISSLLSMLAVPTNTGLFKAVASFISSITAAYFSCSLKKTKSLKSIRATGLFVGITTTSKP